MITMQKIKIRKRNSKGRLDVKNSVKPALGFYYLKFNGLQKLISNYHMPCEIGMNPVKRKRI